jgi:Na+/H+ antiporter NhaD/arsenite permease-like protein
VRWILLALFALTYVGISARRIRIVPVGRPAMAMIGACAMVVVGQFAGENGLSVDEALRAVEPNTIGLLLGMMVVAAGLGEAGFFAWATSWLERRVTSRVALLWSVTLGSGILSAFLVNDAVCLLATPLVVALVKRKGTPMRPFLFAVAMGSNAGSALTLSGNPQNMLVAKLSGLSYREYLVDAAIPALGALIITAAVLHAMFRRELTEQVAVEATHDDTAVATPLLSVTMAALLVVVVANLLGASLALTALAAAAVVLIASRSRADHLLREEIDWSVLLFFSGLFVVVAALQRTGLPAAALAHVGATSSTVGLAAVLSLGSQIVSNVPLILLLEPWIKTFPDPAEAWRITALVTTLAGNLTLLGSVANIIVLERARARMGFVEYLKVGVPVTLLSTTFAVLARWVLS